ncbi:hypothetical protein KGF54_002767 [Candida jiufengensis]|uniref:uncharacterized protein n=1 Tax=Candida jiufengensis TaxID=497108 RepID=UPI0022251F0A|nr:uncharacterized protein KGF54_002767 [Candida jiufengensis]KAI5953395.1 hypothetical protein KGF54_002767 [Candida jiufengensis]
MEKFSTWRDKATGISPFMPHQFPISQNRQNKLITTLQIILIKTPIFILKFPSFILLTLLYYITGSTSLLNLIFKFIFGFNDVNYSVDGIKRSQLDKLQSYKPKIGDLIVTNYSSPLDGFIFNLISGTSSIIILIPDKKGDLYQYTPWSLISHCFGKNSNNRPIEETSKFKHKIVFLLLEGTTSNNQSILPFIKLNPKYTFDGISSIKSMVLKFSPNYFTIPIPINISKFYYLFELLTDFKSKTFKIKIYKFDNFNLVDIRKSFELNSLALINNKDLSIDGKEDFIKYYLNHDIKK